MVELFSAFLALALIVGLVAQIERCEGKADADRKQGFVECLKQTDDAKIKRSDCEKMFRYEDRK